jgi:hypothetical protein
MNDSQEVVLKLLLLCCEIPYRDCPATTESYDVKDFWCIQTSQNKNNQKILWLIRHKIYLNVMQHKKLFTYNCLKLVSDT